MKVLANVEEIMNTFTKVWLSFPKLCKLFQYIPTPFQHTHHISRIASHPKAKESTTKSRIETTLINHRVKTIPFSALGNYKQPLEQGNTLFVLGWKFAPTIAFAISETKQDFDIE